MATGYRAEGTALDFKPDCQPDGSEYRALLAGREEHGTGRQAGYNRPPDKWTPEDIREYWSKLLN